MHLYFNENAGHYLRILDVNLRKNHYTGVTLPYIEKFVLEMKFSKSNIVDYIIKAHSKNKLKSLYCPDIKHIVIHNQYAGHNYNRDNRRGYSYANRSKYKYFIKHLNTFKNAG
jgi:hypothetical protein